MKRLHAGVVAAVAIGCVLPIAAQDVKVITGATLIGTAGSVPLADGAIVIEGGRIARVGPRSSITMPSNAAVIDARGKFVIAGLADMHNHLQSGSFRQQQNTTINLTVLLASGVTTVFNPSIGLTEFASVKQLTARDSAATPRFFGTGPIISVKGDTFGAAVGSPTPESADEARATIAQLKAAGVDAIKVNRDDLSWASTFRLGLMKIDVLTALVDEAHRQGLKVYAHAPLLDPAKEFLRAGGDGLMHGIIDMPVDQEFLTLMQRNRAVYVPTLALFEDVGDVKNWAARQASHVEGGTLSPLAESFKGPDFAQQFSVFMNNASFTKSHLATLRANLKRVFDSGIPVVMGTDTGFYGVMMGAASQMELELMVEAGLTPASALQSATLNAARMIGRETDAGSLEAGKLADLVILDANPLEDIQNVRRVFRVVKGGIVYEPAQLLSNIRFSAPAGRGRAN
jgi:imidazolonepropionase-like amidohydrolase